MKRSPHATGSADGRTSRRSSRRSAISAIASAGAISLAVIAIAGCGSTSSTGPAASGEGVAASAITPATTPSASVPTTTPAPQANIAQSTSHKASKSSKSSGSSKPATVSESSQTSASSQTPQHETAHSTGKPAPIKTVKGNPVRHPTKGTGGHAITDDTPSGKASAADSGLGGKASDPCSLVSRAQAQTFTGRPVAAPKLAPLGPTCVYHALGANAQVTLAVESTVLSKLKSHMQKLTHLTVAGREAYCGVYGSPVTLVPLSGPQVLSVVAPCNVGARFAAAALPKLGY